MKCIKHLKVVQNKKIPIYIFSIGSTNMEKYSGRQNFSSFCWHLSIPLGGWSFMSWFIKGGKKASKFGSKNSMKRLNYWPQLVKLCLLVLPRLPKKIWGLWTNPLYWARGPIFEVPIDMISPIKVSNFINNLTILEAVVTTMI